MTTQIPPELEEKLRDALRNGNKEEAVALLQEAGMSPKAARGTYMVLKLSGAAARMPGSSKRGLENDSSTESGPSGSGLDTSRGAVKGASGCGSLVLVALGAAVFWAWLGI